MENRHSTRLVMALLPTHHGIYHPVYTYLPTMVYTTLCTPWVHHAAYRTWTGVHCVHTDMRWSSDEALGSKEEIPMGESLSAVHGPLSC